MKGRRILDLVLDLMVNNCLNSILKSGILDVLCKLDLEKAYFPVNWDFLLYIMRRAHFGEKWRQ